MSTTETRAGSSSTKAKRPTHNRDTRLGEATVPHPLEERASDSQALQAGLALAGQRVEVDNFTGTSKRTQISPAFQAEMGRIFAAERKTLILSDSDLQLVHQFAKRTFSSELMSRAREAEQERQQQIWKMATGFQGALEKSLRIDSRVLIEFTGTLFDSLRRHTFQTRAFIFTSPDNDLVHNASCTQGGLGESEAIADPPIAIQTHAIPRLLSPAVSCLDGSHDGIPEQALLIRSPEKMEQAVGLLHDSHEEESVYDILAKLSRIVCSEELCKDVREGMNLLLAWLNLKQSKLSQDHSRQFNLTILAFLKRQLGFTLLPDDHRLLMSGLLTHHSGARISIADLSPEVYTTEQLASKLHTTTDTLKRHARAACVRGPLPQRLTSFPGWFVSERSDPRGGQNRGWKFQKLRKPKEL